MRVGWNAKVAGEAVDAEGEVRHEEVAENFAGVHGNALGFASHGGFLVVIVCYLDIERVAVFPYEANPELIIDPDAVLSRAIATKHFQAMSG